MLLLSLCDELKDYHIYSHSVNRANKIQVDCNINRLLLSVNWCPIFARTLIHYTQN